MVDGTVNFFTPTLYLSNVTDKLEREVIIFKGTRADKGCENLIYATG